MLFTEKRHQSLKECPVLIYDPHHLLSKVTRVVRKSFASISARVMNTLMSCISQNELHFPYEGNADQRLLLAIKMCFVESNLRRWSCLENNNDAILPQNKACSHALTDKFNQRISLSGQMNDYGQIGIWSLAVLDVVMEVLQMIKVDKTTWDWLMQHVIIAAPVIVCK